VKPVVTARGRFLFTVTTYATVTAGELSYTYDAANRLIGLGGESYTDDAPRCGEVRT
jgi:hypothetical protein